MTNDMNGLGHSLGDLTMFNISYSKSILITLLLSFSLTGCGKAKTFQQVSAEELNRIPSEMETPETPDTDDIEPESTNAVSNTTTTQDPQVSQPTSPQAPSTQRPTLRPKPPTPRPINRPNTNNNQAYDPNDVLAPTPEGPSKFIQIAQWIINNEARKLGTACNFYVSRVLEIAGYSDDSFIANDFDLYAQRNFSNYDSKSFDSNLEDVERPRMRAHIWSYPERTPFIINWERSGGQHGHIAILERIGNQLVIFQANMNKHLPKRQQTTIENIVSYSRRAKITVYAQFRK